MNYVFDIPVRGTNDRLGLRTNNHTRQTNQTSKPIVREILDNRYLVDDDTMSLMLRTNSSTAKSTSFLPHSLFGYYVIERGVIFVCVSREVTTVTLN